MSLLKQLLAPLLGGGARGDDQALWVYLRCHRCQEIIPLRLRKRDEIQGNYDNEPGYTYFVKKVVMGNRCFNRMDMRLKFDTQYNIVNQEISGGSLISQSEYEAATAGCEDDRS